MPLVPIASIRVLNPLLTQRRSTFQVVVPFAPGAVMNVATLTLEGAEACDLEVFGMRWPDGSVRFARAWGRVAMLPGQTLELPVVVGVRPAVSGATNAIAPNALTPLPPVLGHLTRVAAHSELTHLWGRCWAKWHLRQDLHQPVINFSLAIGYSEPQTTDLFVTLADPIEIALPVATGLIAVPHGPLKGVASRIVGDQQITTFLSAGTRIAHGQAHGWQGVFMTPDFFLAEQKPLIAVATNWKDVGCGPMLINPAFPAWMPDLIGVRVSCERKINQRPAYRDPWFEPKFGIGHTSGETGAQDDFGTIHGNAGFLGQPEWLDLAVPDALQEWCRPTHFREADGSPFRSSAHPRCNMWRGRPHEAGVNISPDQLGKPAANTWDNLGLRAGYDAARSGWDGFDNQHTSLLLTTSAAMMTGDYQLFDILDDYAETFLASYTLPTTHPGYFSSAMDASRAVGRLGYTTSWLNLLLDRSDLRARDAARIDQVVLPHWTATQGLQVRPLDIPQRVNLDKYLDAQGRPLPVQPPEWHPWQEGIAVYGLLCLHAGTGNQHAKEIALGIGESFVLYGWEDRGTYWQIGKAIEWTGSPIATGGTDHRLYLPGDQTDYVLWNVFAVQWLQRNSQRQDVKDRCDAILNGIHDSRPTDGFFSVFNRYSIGV